MNLEPIAFIRQGKLLVKEQLIRLNDSEGVTEAEKDT